MPAPRALLLSLLLSGLTARWADGQGMHQPHASVWPHPKILTRGHGSSRSVVSALRLVNAGPPNDIVDKALSRYHDYLFSEDTGGLSEWQWGPTPGAPPRNCSAAGGTNVGNAGPPLNQLTVTVTNSSTIFGMDGDESYVLDVPVTGDATLTASTPVGAVRGLESFYQLCILRRKQCTYRIPAVPIHVEDAPRWTHRGLLVDTGRDFMSVSKLKAVIEALSWNKMSVLHWHITEIDSFPLELDSVPELSTQSFSAQQVYTKADVRSVIEWGRLCGVRVMPEVDMPGHLTAWGRALPHQNLTIDTGTRHGELDYGIANFASPHLLPTVLKVVKEMAELFVDELFFFGGDETACAYNECDYRDYDNQTERCPHMATERNNFTCPVSGWLSDPTVAAWAAKRGLADHAKLFTYFAEQVEPVVMAKGKTAAWWNDRFDTATTKPDVAPLPSSKPVVENWLRSGSAGLTPYLKAGWRVWQGSGWYLGQAEEQGHYQAPGEPKDSAWKACSEGPSRWAAFYMQDPELNATGATAEQLKLIIGGEASTWGDCISAESFDVLTWPAASSVAERLWSPSTYRNTTEAFPRLAEFRCSMVRRGVGAASLHPGSCWSTREID